MSTVASRSSLLLEEGRSYTAHAMDACSGDLSRTENWITANRLLIG